MKNILTTIGLLLAGFTASAQSVFYEDFENGLLNQFTQEYVVGTLDWTTDAVGLGPASVAFEGDSAAHLYFGGNSEDRTALITPTLDLSSGGYKLGFAHAQPYFAGDQNTLAIHYSGDDGISWTLVDSIVDDIQDYVEVEYDLDDFATTTATSKIRFTGYNTWGYAVGLDAVNVFLPPADDAQVTAVVAPLSGCGLGTETVAIEVFNNGLNPITSIDATYEVGAISESETFTVNIAAGGTDTLYFSTPVDLSVTGSYDFEAWTDLAGDLDLNNDTITFSVVNIPVIASLPYSEDFENGAGGWVSGQVEVANSWELGAPANTLINSANSGTNAWVTNLDGDYIVNEESFVESPCMDFSSLSVDPVFRFAFISETEVGWDGTWVELSTDAGATWTIVGSVGEGTNWYNNADEHPGGDWWDGILGTSGSWLTATHLLDGAAGSSSVKVRVRFSSDVSTVNEGFAFDNVEIFEQPSINAGVTEILSPVTGCGLVAEDVTVVIENFGDADLVDFNIEYQLNNGTPVTQLVTDTLFGAEIDTVTFSAQALVFGFGSYNLSAWTAVVGDGDLNNDTSFTSFANSPVISTLPYLEDFESGDGGWVSTGTNGLWELGDPEGIEIDTANSGFNAWSTNLDSLVYNNNQLSYLTSPCFDFSGLTIDPVIEFAYISNLETGWDGVWLEVSRDAGITWTTLGNVGEGTNWYNNENEHGVSFEEDWWDGSTQDTVEWIMADHLLDTVAGNSNVKLRFVFDSDGSNFTDWEGFALDDISISEQPAINSEVTAVVAPTSGCGLSASEEIQVQVTNLGSVSMDSVIIGFSLDNGNPLEETFSNSIAPGADTTFTLSQTIDLSANGEYNLTVWTATINDGDTDNDTLSIVVTSVPVISSLPYVQDFENGAEGWMTGGINSTWELGEPEEAFIDTANSGVNAWVTNLTGDYVINEDSYVESPCFDFSGISADPILSFAGIFETESGLDEGWVDISLDGGITWTKLGEAGGQGENWYNDPNDDTWTGVSGAANEWLVAEHLMDGAAGQSSVKLRFMFSSDFSINNAGFGLDDISIREQPQLDLAVISFDGPESGCALGEEAITFTFWNKGLSDVSNFDFGFRVDGGAVQTETYSGTVNSGDTVTTIYSAELADLSVQGVYSIDIFTALAGDENNDNDTLFMNMIENFGISTPPSQTSITAVAIPDGDFDGVTSDLFFCGLPTSLDGCLEIDNVTIDSLAHGWMSDVDLYLLSPAGDTLELSTDNGGTGDNMYNVVFSDTSTNDITLQTDGILPGIYHTEDTDGFAGLYNGQDPNGVWSILAIDDEGIFSGNLLGWSMTFVDNSPTPTIDYADTTICLTQVLTVMSDPYDSYLWSTGNSTQQAQLFGNVLGLGDHEILVTVGLDGCTGISNSFTLTVDACAGISELGDLTIDVYPNPSNGEVVLDINGDSQGLNLTVTDVNGKLVYSESINKISNGLRKSIDLKGLSKGMYFMQLNDGNSSVSRKIIIN